MKKKIISVLMAVSMTVMGLTGCSLGTPTAESLIEGTQSEGVSADYDMVITYDVDMVIDEESGAKMNMGMEMDINAKVEEGIQYMEGDINVEALGMSYSIGMEAWAVLEDGELTTYSRTDEDEYWTYEVSEASVDTTLFTGIMLEPLKELTLVEPEKDEKEYVVTAKLDYEDFGDIMNSSTDVDEMVKSLEDMGIDADDFQFDVELIFDRDTKEIKKAKFYVDVEPINEALGKAGKFNEFNITIKYNSFGEELELEVPKSVIREAVEVSDGDSNVDVNISIGADDFSSAEIELGEGVTLNTEENEISTGTAVESEYFEIRTTGTEYGDIFIIAKNVSGEALAAEGKVKFYNDGEIVDMDDIYFYGIMPGASDVDLTWTDEEYDTYEISLEPAEIYNEPLKIDYEILSESDKRFIVSLTNNNDKDAYVSGIALMLYKDGVVLDYDRTYVEELKAGETEELELELWGNGAYDSYDLFITAEER